MWDLLPWLTLVDTIDSVAKACGGGATYACMVDRQSPPWWLTVVG